MNTEKYVLVFPFGLLSHYLRCIVLAQRYYSGYTILFAANPRYDKYVEQAGFGTFECESFDADEVMECSRKFDFTWLNEQDIERVFLSQKKAIEKYNPELVIGDVSPSLKMAAECTGTEHHSLLNGYMTKHYAFTRRVSRAHPAYVYSKIVPEKYFDRITDLAEAISFRLVHRPFKILRKKHKLKYVSGYLSELEGDQNLICDLSDLFPQRKLPGNYKSIGPLLFQSKKDESIWLSELKRDKPIICVCMGSSGNWTDLKFLNSEQYACYTIVTGGDTNKELNAPHIISRDFIDLDEILPLSSLMICHGGNGTLYHGLLHGVFMLCLTAHFEQEWNVHALQRIGYGMSANDFTLSDWRLQIEANSKRQLKPYFNV